MPTTTYGDQTYVTVNRRRHHGARNDTRKGRGVFGQEADPQSGSDHRQNPILPLATVRFDQVGALLATDLIKHVIKFAIYPEK